MERFIYRSPSHGPIEVRSTVAGAVIGCPDDLERALTRWANRGEPHDRVDVAPEAFMQLAGCVADMAAFAPGRVQTITDDQLCDEFVRRQLPISTIGGAPMRTATDAQVNAEAQRRNLYKPLHARMDSLSDDELRAECERRKLISGDLAVVDLVRASDAAVRAEMCRRWPGSEAAKMWMALSAERDHWKDVAEATSVNLRTSDARRDEWRAKAEAATSSVWTPVMEQVVNERDSFKKERDNWQQTSRHHAESEDYYRKLVIRCGEALGPAAKTQDDGGVVPDVLCAKVPELVEQLARAVHLLGGGVPFVEIYRTTDRMPIQRVGPKDVKFKRLELGAGIVDLPSARPGRATMLDEASLADLLADDAEGE